MMPMSPQDEKREAQRLLAGLENGSMSATEAAILAEDLDPVFVYVIVTFLRKVYPASDPAATPVLERVVAMTASSPLVVGKHREGGQDPVSHWFESEYSWADFHDRGPELVDLIADKLES